MDDVECESTSAIRHPPSSISLRLLADAMLGALARWLRVLGYDTTYDASLSDHALVRLARAEGRVLLTRDRELAGRRNIQKLFIVSQRWDAQVRQVLTELPLPALAPFTRCLVCNAPLLPMLLSEARGLVPPYVFVTHRRFRLCPDCNRVYWRGTHREHMETTIAAFCAAWRSAHGGWRMANVE